MRSLWKGLIIGSVAGAGVGLALEGIQPPLWTPEDDPRVAIGQSPVDLLARVGRRHVCLGKGFILGSLIGAGVGLALDLGAVSGPGLDVTHRWGHAGAACAVGDIAEPVARRAAGAISKAADSIGDLADDAAQAAHDGTSAR